MSSRFRWYEFAARQASDLAAGTCKFLAVPAPQGGRGDGDSDGGVFDDGTDGGDGDGGGRRRDPDADPLSVPFPHGWQLRYVIWLVDVGSGMYGLMAVSWVDDDEGQGWG